MRAPSLTVLALALLAAPTVALDIIELKDGKILTVERVSVRGDKLHVRLSTKADQFAAYSIPLAKVVPEFVYYAWANQVKTGDVDEYLRLAAWARRQGLFRHAWRTYERASAFSQDLKGDLPELKTAMHEEEATWNFAEAERLFHAQEVKEARMRVELILAAFADTQEAGRAKELLSMIAEREQFLDEQRKQEELARIARKQKRTVDRHLQRIAKADHVAAGANYRHLPSAARRLQYAGYTYVRAATGLANLLPRIEVDALRRTVRELLEDLDTRTVRTFVRLADLLYLMGDTPSALDAVHEVLALDPDNRAAEGLRERILDRGDPVPDERGALGGYPVFLGRRGIRYGRGTPYRRQRLKPAYHPYPYPRRTFHTYPEPWRYQWYAVRLGLP
ncbi:MAG: tetratricopeptide repeat protein [Planctomycetota bacterium]|jgi:tetratricopeptide (TPR) repeat protein